MERKIEKMRRRKLKKVIIKNKHHKNAQTTARLLLVEIICEKFLEEVWLRAWSRNRNVNDFCVDLLIMQIAALSLYLLLIFILDFIEMSRACFYADAFWLLFLLLRMSDDDRSTIKRNVSSNCLRWRKHDINFACRKISWQSK